MQKDLFKCWILTVGKGLEALVKDTKLHFPKNHEISNIISEVLDKGMGFFINNHLDLSFYWSLVLSHLAIMSLLRNFQQSWSSFKTLKIYVSYSMVQESSYFNYWSCLTYMQTVQSFLVISSLLLLIFRKMFWETEVP